MNVIDGAAVPDHEVAGGPSAEPVCVVLDPGSAGQLAGAARWVQADPSVVSRLREQAPRRPLVLADDRRLSLVAFAVDELGRPAAVHLHVGDRGLLAVCADGTAPLVRRAVAGAGARPDAALVAVVLAVARLSEDVIERLSDEVMALDAGTTGLTSGARRRAVARVRGLLFSLQQLWAAHQRALVADGRLIEALPADSRPALRRAGGIFESSGAAAGQLYALLGDTLSRQATIINERLTLVAVIFFPLTVSTGFFGMNFGWLTGRIGSAAAFVLLGLVLPGVLVAATLLGARWLTRD